MLEKLLTYEHHPAKLGIAAQVALNPRLYERHPSFKKWQSMRPKLHYAMVVTIAGWYARGLTLRTIADNSQTLLGEKISQGTIARACRLVFLPESIKNKKKRQRRSKRND